MMTRITPIKPNERSDAVANLHVVMQMLGYAVAADELNDRRAGPTTIALVREVQQRMHITPHDGTLIDDATASAVNKLLDDRGVVLTSESRNCWIKGRVTVPGGGSARDLVVTAYDQDLRKRQELGRTRTRSGGDYLIHYGTSQFANAEQGGADLVLEVRTASGEPLYTSDIFFNVDPAFNCDIAISKRAGDAEYDSILLLVGPLLAGQDVALNALDETDKLHDIGFLAGETGLARDRLVDFAVAQRLANEKLPAQFWFGALRSGALMRPLTPPAGWPSLADLAKATLAQAQATAPGAIDDGGQLAAVLKMIDASHTELAGWRKAFDALLQSAGKAPADAGVEASETPLPFGHVTRLTQAVAQIPGLPGDKHQAVIDAWLEAGSRENAVRKLRAGKTLDAGQLQAVDTHLAAHELSFGDTRLVAALEASRKLDARSPRALRHLARMDAPEWEQMMKDHDVPAPAFVGGTTVDAKRANYARLMTLSFQGNDATGAFSGGLARALKIDPDTVLPQAAPMARFLDANAGFDLAATHIDRFLKEKAGPDSAPLANDPAFVRQLKATQRVFKLARNFDATRTLLADDLHSAQQVYRTGKQAFVRKYANKPGFDATSAAETFERAANTHAAALAIVGDLHAMETSHALFALNSGADAVSDFPNLANLFGKADACECEDCRSVFSATAYLADMLMYLEARKAANGVTPVKNVLFDRRPDIGEIELTCANTNTTLPYVDLACEVLEDRVAPWKLFDLPGALAGHFVKGPADAAVRAAFAAAVPGVALTAAATISTADHLGDWIVRDTDQDGDHSWCVHPAGGMLRVSILRQTRGTSEELSANPEYVNEAAYAQLSAASFPMSLPFDLPSEEVDAYLGKIGVRRSALMEAFRGTAAPNDPADLDIAAAHVGLAPAERVLICSADTANQYRYWGETTNPALVTALSHVDTFLTRTGLEYDDLSGLLALGFVNPDGAVQIRYLDTSCDLSQRRLQPIDENVLDRMHRFLRLWRRLGWKMWEVDLAIRNKAIGNGTLDNDFLVRLYPFLQVRDRLKLSVEEACALFDRINTQAGFSGSSSAPAPSLYERLFLNKRVMDKLDPLFAIDKVTAADATPVPVGTPDIAPDHLAPVLAATRVSDADLAVLLGLMRPVAHPPPLPVPWIQGKLHLGDLSFLYRHALLAKTLRIKASDWARLLYVLQTDVFASPAALLAFLVQYDRITQSGFSTDELAYVLAADLSVKPAEIDKNIAGTLTVIRKGMQTIGTAAVAPLPTDTDGRVALITAQLQALGWDAAGVAALGSLFKPELRAAGMPADFAFPAAIAAAIPISFNSDTLALGFRGLMSDAQRQTLLNDASLAAVTGLPAYQSAVAALFNAPRAATRFYWPEFRTALKTLPLDVQFPVQLSPELAAKVGYDAERRQLVFFGVMAAAERDTLNGLSNDAAYVAAVLDLFAQPAGAVPADRLWVDANDDLASAAAKLVAYVAATTARQLVAQQFSQALRISPAVTEALLTGTRLYGVPKHALMDDFLDNAFAASSAAITAAAFPDLFNAYRWLHRVALVANKTKARFGDLDWLRRNTAPTGVLDFTTLPLVFDDVAPALASTTALLDLARFMALHHAFSTEDLSLLDMLDRVIADATYTNGEFALDVETLTGWPQADVQALTAANALSSAYPADYAKVAAWDRLTRCFDLLMRLNAAAPNAMALAAPAMTVPTSQTLKQLLRGKFEVDQWLDIGKSVQDGLRQRKRDSLVDYLLIQPMPVDAPSNKWENAHDLYAYCLIDVEMCACLETSRVVQATNSVQLFTQRCFMGLEPKVRVSVDLDDAWAQWTWMKNYRVWEANRRVFVYPENYALPELKSDRSEMFKKLEDELLQNDVTKDNVETAFLHYLEKLDEIAQLEIAGTYYQESIHTLHVFGRTPGSEPHTYYYRQFIDSLRWTPWAKVECDIKSDYLVPLVANERLHLVWPEFREQPDDQGSVNIPSQGESNKALDKPKKKMDVYLAVTELRSDKWLPKKVSQSPVSASTSYQDDFDQSPYVILPLDFTAFADGPFLLLVGRGDSYSGGRFFELAGCKGYPEPYDGQQHLIPLLTHFQRDKLSYIKNVEDPGNNGDALVPVGSMGMFPRILDLTPGLFKISYPQYMSYFDKLYVQALADMLQKSGYGTREVSNRGLPFYVTLGTFYDWFYADKLRTFFVQQEMVAPNGTAFFYKDIVALFEQIRALLTPEQEPWLIVLFMWLSSRFGKLRFNNFYHPLTCFLTKQLYAKGVDGLLSRETQFKDKQFDFNGLYGPTSYVDAHYPQELVDFTPGASYSQYNWELFYFAPLMIANKLSANQQFEDAMHWFHYIFDPTGGHDKDPVTGNPAPAPQKYWITQPFFNRLSTGPGGYEAQRVEALMNMLAAGVGSPPTQAIKDLQDYIGQWRENPFDPHIVAQFRTVAYQKLTVMKYIDNLLAWGDQQFRQFTMESVNLATQLYVLAAEILGPRPRKVPPPSKPTAETYNEIESKLDAFSNAMVELENFVPAVPSGGGGGGPGPALPSLLYFCIPQNDQMVAYWDRVDDRLDKIRHCLDIDGVARSLSLFAPQIDPMALIKAMAGGADLASAIAALDAPLSNYRFAVSLQKANEFTGDLKALGGALLVALEKKDAEALLRLRQQQEILVLNAVRAIKQAAIEESQHALEGLQKSREMVTLRRDYYASRPLISPGEGGAMTLNTASLVVHAAGAVADVLGGVIAAIPDFQIGASGFGGSPHASAKTGGASFSKAAELAARALYQTSTLMDKGASITSTLAGYQRRMDDWQHQLTLADKELEQMDRQLAAAQVRLDNAQRELANQDLQIANSKAIDDFFHDKFTSQELYQWMVTQISQTYFQSYQLAFDMARRAERCFQYELGLENTSYIQFGYWDSLKSGLQAGERLQLALRQLESAYQEGNRREFECTKHISLALVNPLALLQLKDSGTCVVDIPEELFDLDYPGHFFRRLKTVGLSLPCVAGPHTTVSCTLRLIRNMVRINSNAGAQYEHNNDSGVFTDDTRFRESHLRVNAIATSNGQNDNGMFELNFRDDRYLPFEGAGAVSSWQIELVAERGLRQFDYDTLSDVILHLRYTSREDAGNFKNAATDHLKTVLQDSSPTLRQRRMFDLKREFATEWYAFLHPAPGGQKTLQIQLTRQHFPMLGQSASIQVEAISIAVQTQSDDEMKVQLHPPLDGTPAGLLTLPAPGRPQDFRTATKKNIGDLLDPATPWAMRIRKTALQFDDLDPDEVEECFLVVEYTLQP